MNEAMQKSPVTMTPEEMQAKRELDAKPFNEITDSQKIDRLAELVRYLQDMIGSMNRGIYQDRNKINLLMKHTHTDLGKVAIEMENAQSLIMGTDSLGASIGRQLPRL